MDPSMYVPYSPPTGLPQESKLATYMNRSVTTPATSMSQAMSKLSLESSPTVNKKNIMPHPQPPQALIAHMPIPQVLVGEFIPINFFGPPPTLPESPRNSPPDTIALQPVNTQVHQENVGGTTYFYPTSSDGLNASMNASLNASMNASLNASMNASINASMNASLNASLNPAAAMVGEPCMGVPSPYAPQIYGVPAHVHMQQMMPQNKQGPGLAATFYTPAKIRAEMYERNEDVFLQPDPHLPAAVEAYSQLVPLEPVGPHSLASSYRGTDRTNAEQYALRRLHGCALPAAAISSLEAWRNLDHPNVVHLHRCFPTKDFGDHSTVLVYDYYPGSVTLMDKFLPGGALGGPVEANVAFHDPFSSDPDAPRPYTHQKNAMLRAVACGALLPESEVWSALLQLSAGLRAIHSAGLSCRTLDLTKVVMSGCRIRIAWCGIADLLQTSNIDINQAQQEDLAALGRLALSLACRSAHCDNLPACIDMVARSYTADLKNLIVYLLTPSSTLRSVTDLMPLIGARFYTQVEALERREDAFEDQLALEMDNGRLLRILIKLGVINERPELNMDTSWSETGDRYMLKLFRDHLFHSVTADGRPWLDQAHLATALNNLDGGSVAKVELMSRDEQSVLVVSYSELKHCLETAFEEVMQAAL